MLVQCIKSDFIRQVYFFTINQHCPKYHHYKNDFICRYEPFYQPKLTKPSLCVRDKNKMKNMSTVNAFDAIWELYIVVADLLDFPMLTLCTRNWLITSCSLWDINIYVWLWSKLSQTDAQFTEIHKCRPC